MSLGVALAFDPHHHQYVLERHHAALQTEDVDPNRFSNASSVAREISSLVLCLWVWYSGNLHSNSHTLYLFACFVCFEWQLQLDCDSNRSSWQSEKDGHLNFRPFTNFASVEILALSFVKCSHVFKFLLPIIFGLFSWSILGPTLVSHTFSWDKITKLPDTQTTICPPPAACFLQMKFGIHGFVPAWWLLGFMYGLSVSLRNPEKLVCLSASFSVFLCPPWGTSQIVSARQQLYVPQRQPKYPGNQASFSL